VIGEKIRLETALAPEPHTVWMDPGQLDHVVMNLAVNAKEAMPDGGTLIIETANVDLDPEYFRMRGVAESPGPYVLLAISDTGIGMDKETLSHIFEPFFSLKGKTRGTGLGLSTVYGIVKQNRGYIWFYSEPGKGSTCRIYLPALRGDIPAEPPREKTLHGYSGTETVLVAEDDDHLRHFVCKVLRQRGYFVLEAETGEAALKASAAHDGSIDLLLSDVVMPGIDGRELAQAVLRQRPGTRVLFMSGYTERAISQLKALGPDTNFLPKPFTPETLCRMIRKLLD
jgi:CheY-like chemotaxis protein